jgi:hypothetical protein
MSGDPDEARAERMRRRAQWPGSLLRLEEMPEYELLDAPAAELIGMVTVLTRQSWAMRGEAIPSYERARAWGRIRRHGHDQ